MSSQYSSTSPYFLTGYSQFFLDVMVNRPIPKSNDDILFTINTTFQYRPDQLAFDLYGQTVSTGRQVKQFLRLECVGNRRDI